MGRMIYGLFRLICRLYFQDVLPMMKLVEKIKIGSDDMIYRTVSYISANFNKSISLDGMAHDLGVGTNFHYPDCFRRHSIAVLINM